jgi:hypothetical protein
VTPKTRKNTLNNKFDGDVKSSLKNYYNKFNLTFDPEKYIKNGTGRISRSFIVDLDNLPEKNNPSSILKF